MNAIAEVEEGISNHLESMRKILGPLPKCMLEVRNGRQSTAARRLLQKYLDDPIGYALSGDLSSRLLLSMPKEEAEAFGSFIRSVLQYEPEKRLSAQEILRLPWLTERMFPKVQHS